MPDDVKYNERTDMRPPSPPPKEIRITLCLLTSAFATSLGTSFLMGYNVSVMTGPSAFIQSFYNHSYYEQYGLYLSEGHSMWLWAVTISIFPIGGSLGALVTTYLTNAIGRRRTLIVTCVIYVIASFLMGISQFVNVYQLVIVGRFVVGVAAGMAVVAAPLYLSEISPVKFRGGVTAVHELGVSSGVAAAQVLGLYPLYSQELWPVLLAMTGVFSLIGCSMLAFCPESPRWYLITSSNTQHTGESDTLRQDVGNRYKARESLKRLRGIVDVEAEIVEMMYERRHELSEARVGMLDVISLKDPMWKWPLIISIVLHSGQALAGINAIYYYTTELFTEANLSENAVKLASCGTGLVNLITDAITVSSVDKLGRRFLLLFSYSVMTAATVFLTISLALPGDVWSYLSIVAVYMFLIGFSPGAGVTTMVILPEIWTQGPRPAALSIASQFNWWSSFIVGLAFPFMLEGLEGYSLLVFTAILVIILLFLYFVVPETKNKTFAAISSRFKMKYGSTHQLVDYTREGSSATSL